MPERYRAPVVLCDLEGLTRRQAADQLGWPEGSLSSRLSRARAILAARLTRRGVALAAGSLTAALTTHAVSACPSSHLVGATVQAGGVFSTADALARGLISPRAVDLAKGVSRAMLISKLKMPSFVLLTLGLVLGGAAVSGRFAKTADAGTEQPEKASSASARLQPRPVLADETKGGKPEPAQDVEVRALLQKRVAVLQAMADLAAQRHEQKTASLEEVQRAKLRVLQAELDLRENEKERIEIHQKIVAIHQSIADRVAALQAAGQASQEDLSEAQLHVLDAQIALKREEAKAAKAPKP